MKSKTPSRYLLAGPAAGESGQTHSLSWVHSLSVSCHKDSHGAFGQEGLEKVLRQVGKPSIGP